MWPFRSKPEPPDNRPPSAAAKAIAVSLESEPARWMIGGRDGSLLIHDSGINIDVLGDQVNNPWGVDEPEANEVVIRDAVNKWIAARLALPVPPTEGEGLPGATP